MPGDRWSRRTFLSAAGLSGAAALSPGWVKQASALAVEERGRVFVSASSTDEDGAIHSFEWRDGVLQKVGETQSLRPASMAVHPTLPVLYAANDCREFGYRPRAAVEAFAIDERSGRLVSAAQRGLSLSATGVRRIAVSPDGRSLMVTAADGGALNRFVLRDDGVMAARPHIAKLTGCGQDAARQASAKPHDVVFPWADGPAMVSDAGADRLRWVEVDGKSLSALHGADTERGAGVAHLAWEPKSETLFAAGMLRPTLTAYRMRSGHVVDVIQAEPVDAVVTALATHKQFGVVYMANGGSLTAWQVAAESGKFTALGSLNLNVKCVRSAVAHGSSLWCISEQGLHRVSLHSKTGELLHAEPVAPLKNAHSVVVQGGLA